MITIGGFVVKMMISSAILYGYYFYCLRNKQFHHYNRWYLILSVGISIMIPFLTIKLTVVSENSPANKIIALLDKANPATIMETVRSTNSSTHPAGLVAKPGSEDYPAEHLSPKTSSYNGNSLNDTAIHPIVIGAYFLIAGICILRLMKSLWNLMRLHRKYALAKQSELNNFVTHENHLYVARIRVLKTDLPGTPYSFFNTIYWNQDQSFDSAEGQQLLKHEFYHIKQKHSWDAVFIELIIALCWFNPLFLLIKRELLLTHEFQADAFARCNNSPASYAELLLKHLLAEKQRTTFIQPFNHSSIKRRIAMIVKKQTPERFFCIRRIAALPIAFLVITCFSVSAVKSQVKETSTNEKTTKSVTFKRDSKLHEIERHLANTLVFPAKPTNEVIVTVSVDIDPKERISNFHILPPNSPEATESTTIVYYVDYKSNNQLTDTPPDLSIFEKEVSRAFRSFDNYEEKLILPATKVVYNIVFKNPQSLEKSKSDMIFQKTEVPPMYTTGEQNWKDYLKKNIQKELQVQGETVVVQFIVDAYGKVVEPTITTSANKELDKEVVRVIEQSSGSWSPAIQNKRLVRAYKKETIRF